MQKAVAIFGGIDDRGGNFVGISGNCHRNPQYIDEIEDGNEIYNSRFGKYLYKGRAF